MAHYGLKSAALSGTNQSRMIDATYLDAFRKGLHFRVVPYLKGVILKGMKLVEVDIDDLLFHAPSGVFRFDELLLFVFLRCLTDFFTLGCRLLTLGHFVPKRRLGLVGGRLASLRWAAPARLCCWLPLFHFFPDACGASFFSVILGFSAVFWAVEKSTTLPGMIGFCFAEFSGRTGLTGSFFSGVTEALFSTKGFCVGTSAFA